MAKRILTIDATILNTLQTCGYKTFLSFQKHLRAVKTPEVFERGDLVHHMLEMYYKSLKDGATKEEAAIHAEARGREKYPTLELQASECEWIIQSFHLYIERWKDDGIKVLEVEEAFIFKCYEDDELEAYYSGKIDLFAEFPLIGAIPIDHKSRTRKNEETVLNNQFMGYSIAKGCNYVYVNEFGLQTSLKPEDKFRRMPLSFTDSLKAHWLNNILKFWVRQLDYYAQNNIWPEQWNPYICKNCVFNEVCKSGTYEEKLRKIKTGFIESEPWDVTKALEGKEE